MNGRIIKQLRVIITDESDTAGTGCYDIFIGIEIIQKFTAHGTCIIPKAGIKSRLSATGLIRIIGNSTTGFLQNLDHVESCIRKKLVYKAGYEKLYVHPSGH